MRFCPSPFISFSAVGGEYSYQHTVNRFTSKFIYVNLFTFKNTLVFFFLFFLLF